MSQRLQTLLIDDEIGSLGNFSPLSPATHLPFEGSLKQEKVDHTKKLAPKLNKDLIDSNNNSENSTTEAGDGIPAIKIKQFEFAPTLNGGGASIPASL